jgi:hypothetical protein
MKTKLLALFSLLALLLVSTAALADGRPTGLRIGRAVSGGGSEVEIDITVTGTDYFYGDYSSTVWLNYGMENAEGWQFTSQRNYPIPFAIDWGDGEYRPDLTLFGPSTGPWTGTFSHTYGSPGTYVITVGDAVCCSESNSPPGTPITGNGIFSSTRFVQHEDYSTTWTYGYSILLAITANATVTTGTGIPTLNIYGLLAMAFVLVGTGVLLFRKPQQA